MAIPQSPIGTHASGLGPLTMMTLLAVILLMELVAWGSLQAGVGMKVGVGDLFWTLIAIVTLGGVVLGAIVRALLKRRFRFGIRELLVATLLVGVGLGWLMNLLARTSDQRSIAARLSGSGAVVEFGGVDEPGFETLIGREYFHGVTAIYGHDSTMSRKNLTELRGLRDLEILTLGGPQVTDTALSDLEGTTGLRRLGLLDTGVTGAGLAHLGGLTNLESLDLYRSPVNDEGLAHLERLPNLRWLNLNLTPVSDAGLVHAGRLAKLEGLALDRTGVTDAGLGYLAGLRDLRDLSLAGTQITDKGLEPLRVMGGLKRLNLERSRVTDEGVRKLRQARPELVISK